MSFLMIPFCAQAFYIDSVVFFVPMQICCNSARVMVRALACYRCIWYGPDEQGQLGVYLGFDVAKEGGRAMKKAIVQIAPCILTVRQYWELAVSEFRRRVLHHAVKPYAPAFGQCVQHFCIHAGTYARLMFWLEVSSNEKNHLSKEVHAIVRAYRTHGQKHTSTLFGGPRMCVQHVMQPCLYAPLF
jgi:FAE1/Type III polyketide synthase-like protein